ncbi:MAG: MnmC family methyltransferase [Bacteriovorax sp.]|nr:MnmC family methyltransferase [Bacteriovorax sp.]
MTDFKGNLGNYKILKTEDNTETVWSEFFDEACHNLSGAYEETIYNYIQGCSIPDLLARKSKIAVLDVGFGVGLGLKALIDQVQASKNHTISLSYYSIELDETLMLWSLRTTLPGLVLKRIEKEQGLEKLVFYGGAWQESNKKIEVQIYIGDGRLTLPLASRLSLIKPLDAIFQDAFSPRKNPTLWSVEWFLFLKSISSQWVQLSTYSSSVRIRKSLLAADWIIEDALGFAHKKSMTKAKITGETSADLLLRMTRSPSLEIRDK